jgi:hypothetical protein
MKKQIKQIRPFLRQLVGLPLWSIGKAGSFITWFAFGNNRRTVVRLNGKKKVVSEFSLHVQCAWRIRSKNKIIIASSEDQEENQFYKTVKTFLKHQNQGLILVTGIKVDEIGNLSIALNHDSFLEVFPNSIGNTEFWRFFKPYSEESHLFFTANGIEFD